MFEMSAEFWAAIFGAILGSVSSGAISAYLQNISNRRAEKTRREDKIERDILVGISTFFIICRMLSDLRHVSEFFSNLQSSNEYKSKLGEWAEIPGVISMPRPHKFSSSEKIRIMRIKNKELAIELHSLDEFHNGVVEEIERYSFKRSEISDYLINCGVEREGDFGQVILTADQMRFCKARAVSMDALLNSIRKNSSKFIDRFPEISEQLAQEFRSELEFMSQ